MSIHFITTGTSIHYSDSKIKKNKKPFWLNLEQYPEITQNRKAKYT